MTLNKGKRVLGVDFGDKRTGLAISDEGRFIATGICTVTAEGMKKLAIKISETIKDYDISQIVMGLPINMDGSESKRADKTQRFAKLLEETLNVPVILQDERLTTVEAYEIMNLTGSAKKSKKKNIDTLSAEIILQEYLDKEKRN